LAAEASAVFGNLTNNASTFAQPDGKVVVAGGTGDFTRGITDRGGTVPGAATVFDVLST
jgi:hypothetical protein